MSIKGTTEKLLVNRYNSTIITFWANKKNIDYKDLKCINYMYAAASEVGYLDFISNNNKTIRFDFRINANEQISRTVKLIEEHNPELNITEYKASDLKLYERWWFIVIISFFCCAPIGFFLMWHKKKSNQSFRILFTTLIVLLWSIGGYSSYMNYVNVMANTNAIFEDYQKTLDGAFSTNAPTEQKQIEGSQSADSDESTEVTAYSVGDVYESDTFKIMYLNSGDYSVENEYMQPESGNKYIFAEFSIENVGTSDYSTGSVLFDCYADNTECKQPIISAEGTLTAITSLSSGKNTKGKIFFEVPSSAGSIELEYKINSLTDEKIRFTFK